MSRQLDVRLPSDLPAGSIPSTIMSDWVDRERRTARLIRACYVQYLGGSPSAGQVLALCKLTWITNGPDNTSAVVTPALSVLTGLHLTARDPSALGKELRRSGAPDDVVRPASKPVGYTNFYAGFRNIALDWIEAHQADVLAILRSVAEARNDDEVRGAYAAVDQLPPLRRPRAGDMRAFGLLTPILACLDPRGRAPIINGRDAVKRRLGMLGLSSASLVEQYAGLKGLIGQAGIDDAFALDRADDKVIEKAMKKAGRSPPAAPGGHGRPPPKPLQGRLDEDLEYLRSVDPITMKHRHNSMTNALLAACQAAAVVVEEGSEQTCMFDALVRAYDGGERHLLIEVKTEDSPPMCRMAVGQLLDYRRQLGDRAAIDLAVLLPGTPSQEAMDFLGYVGVKVMWLDGALIAGQVPIE